MWRMRIACWINKATDIRNDYCFSTATIVARKRLRITSHYIACLANLAIAKFGNFSCDVPVSYIYSLSVNRIGI